MRGDVVGKRQIRVQEYTTMQIRVQDGVDKGTRRQDGPNELTKVDSR